MSTPRVTTTLLKPAQDPARVLVVGAGLGTGVQALWSLAAQQLPEDTVVVGYDLPGHGASEPHAEPFSMAELADAFIALPGGLGTLEELFEVWTWGQLGYHPKPLGLLDVNHFYTADQFLLCVLHAAPLVACSTPPPRYPQPRPQ